MGNSCATGGNSVLLETHEPDFKWKIHGFSAHLFKGSISSNSSWFDCCGYQWYLVVNPSHKIVGAGTPQVAVGLGLVRTGLKPGHFISAVFELSMYNHSNGTYCGRKASYVFHVKNAQSDRKCLIPLAELLNSSEFLVDDSCTFGVKILAANVISLKMKHTPLVHQNRTTTTQNLYLRKEGFIKGTYTWSMTDFLDLALKPSVLSPVFEVGGYKWHIKMYPRGNECSTRSMSLYLYLHSPDELPRESGRMIELTVTILNQKYTGERYSYKRQGSPLHDSLVIIRIQLEDDLILLFGCDRKQVRVRWYECLGMAQLYPAQNSQKQVRWLSCRIELHLQGRHLHHWVIK